ncbi:uncharacterized protein LOC116169602 [Photinus pyralis]|uniref:uncharacterized protein LOC116169602 n=1 Tax=Photinus pyralis TaxID=7054 RepID=UPI0012672F79|nr:uncharacterized protein LOC116169602 [Photinus pyralis]
MDIRQACRMGSIDDFFNRDGREVVENLQNLGFFKKSKRCLVRTCRRQMRLCPKAGMYCGYAFRCSKCKRGYLSITDGTFFEGLRLDVRDIFKIIFLWSCYVSVDSASRDLGLRRGTVMQYYTFIRDTCSWKLLNEIRSRQLGGVGHVVQVDESVVTKRKCHQARLAKEKWVVGLYDVNDERGTIALVDDRSERTLKGVLTNLILPGTEIWTDEGTGYKFLQNYDGVSPYTHHTVNDSRDFVNPATGVHTNVIGGYRSLLEEFCRRMGVVPARMLPHHVDEFLWRREFKDSQFTNILNHILEKYPQ